MKLYSGGMAVIVLPLSLGAGGRDARIKHFGRGNSELFTAIKTRRTIK